MSDSCRRSSETEVLKIGKTVSTGLRLELTPIVSRGRRLVPCIELIAECTALEDTLITSETVGDTSGTVPETISTICCAVLVMLSTELDAISATLIT